MLIPEGAFVFDSRGLCVCVIPEGLLCVCVIPGSFCVIFLEAFVCDSVLFLCVIPGGPLCVCM